MASSLPLRRLTKSLRITRQNLERRNREHYFELVESFVIRFAKGAEARVRLHALMVHPGFQSAEAFDLTKRMGNADRLQKRRRPQLPIRLHPHGRTRQESSRRQALGSRPALLTFAFNQPADPAKKHNWLVDDNSAEPFVNLGAHPLTRSSRACGIASSSRSKAMKSACNSAMAKPFAAKPKTPPIPGAEPSSAVKARKAKASSSKTAEFGR